MSPPIKLVRMLITTGKSNGKSNRAIASALFLATPGSLFWGRGKRTLAALVRQAKKKRFSRICAIYSRGKAGQSINFLSLEGGQTRWLSPKIVVQTLSAPKRAHLPRSSSLALSGPKAKVLRRLMGFCPRAKAGRCKSKISASAKKLSFFIGGKKALELGVSYEK